MKNSRIYSVALIIYLFIVAWFVLLSREPLDETVIKLRSETIMYFLGSYSDWQNDATALHPEALLIGDILNVFLFLPIGFLTQSILALKKKRRSLLLCTLWGLVCSLSIEVIQLLTRLGWFDVDDLLMNTLGTVLGGIIYILLARAVRNLMNMIQWREKDD